MPCSVEATVANYQEFPSPEISIGAHPCAVKGNAYDRGLQSIFGHTAGNMSMVMLYGNDLPAGPAKLPGISGGQIIGVEITGDDFRLDMEQSSIQGYGGVKMLQRFHVLHVTDML